MAISMATLLQAMVVVLALLSKRAAACPAGATAVPSAAIGSDDNPSEPQEIVLPTYCCPGNSTVKTWTLRKAFSRPDTYLGSITATCSDGTTLPIIEAQPGVGGVDRLGPRQTTKAQRWNTFTARGGSWVDKFLSIGGRGGNLVEFSCPAGQYAVGFKAMPFYFGLDLLQVICGPSQ